MIELRWMLDKKKSGGLQPVFEDWILQYRYRIRRKWSAWENVPYVPY